MLKLHPAPPELNDLNFNRGWDRINADGKTDRKGRGGTKSTKSSHGWLMVLELMENHTANAGKGRIFNRGWDRISADGKTDRKGRGGRKSTKGSHG
jgi:hypothetical protein